MLDIFENDGFTMSNDFSEVLAEISNTAEYYLENNTTSKEDEAFLLGVMYTAAMSNAIYKHKPVKFIMDINAAKKLYEQYKEDTPSEIKQETKQKKEKPEYVQISIEDLMNYINNSSKPKSKQKKD